MLDVRRLRLLRELSVRGTIAGVAEALSFSPSAVSQQLALLERETGVPLLRRVGRNVFLTAEAERLTVHTGTLLNVLEEAEAELTVREDRTTGTVRVAAFQSALMSFVPVALVGMRRRHPEVRVEVNHREPGRALAATAARDVDLVIAEEYPGHVEPLYEGLVRTDLTHDRLHLAVPQGREGEQILRVGDAAAMPWTMEPKGTASRHFAEQVCRRAGFEPDVRYVTEDLHSQIALIESGSAVGLLPGLMWSATSTKLRRVSIAGKKTRQIFTAHRSGSSEHAAVRAFRAELDRAITRDPELQ